MEVTVLIPAVNEEAAVGQVVAAVLAQGVREAIVVDNGSVDATAQVAAQAGARVLREDRRGYGSACLAGATAAVGNVLVFMDADGSFVAEEIRALVQPIEEGRADLVVGARVSGLVEAGALPFHQWFGNTLAAWLLRLFYGLRVRDLGPFRAVRSDALAALGMVEMTYGWPIEMMVKAAKMGYRVVEVPVSYRARRGGRSKVSGTLRGTVLAGYGILSTILRHAPTRRGGP